MCQPYIPLKFNFFGVQYLQEVWVRENNIRKKELKIK